MTILPRARADTVPGTAVGNPPVSNVGNLEGSGAQEGVLPDSNQPA